VKHAWQLAANALNEPPRSMETLRDGKPRKCAGALF
jgi:hypothetical protein